MEFLRYRNGANLWYDLLQASKFTLLAGWLVARVLGLAKGNWATTDFSFDVLSLQALFLVYLFLNQQLNLGSSGVFLPRTVALLWTAITKYSPPKNKLG